MAEYITDDGSPHARSTGSTISNAARSAFVVLITRHDLQDITIRGVRDHANLDFPARIVHIEYTDGSSHGDGDTDSQPKTIRADATPLTDDDTPAGPGDEATRWEVEIVDTFSDN
jgi:hypothetical protein